MYKLNSNTNKSYYTKLRVSVFVLLASCFFSSYAQNIAGIDRKQLFDNDWKFFLGDPLTAASKKINEKNWRKLDLPHDWSIEGKIDRKNPTGKDGGYFPAGVAWYRKTFKVPQEWKGKNVSIYFEGVYMNSEVFINGVSLGTYPYGYSSFSYSLSPHLAFGQENVIAVRVDNSQHKNSRWYSGSGIYRHVWMMVSGAVHVDNWGVAITTPEVSSKEASVQIKTLVENETNSPQNIILKTQILAGNSKSVADNQTKVQLPARSKQEVIQIIKVSNPLLWTSESPYLHQAKVQIIKDNQVVDGTKTNFGIRSIKFTAENGFQLNGKTVKINGGCVHHDNGCLGSAAFDRAEERKVELLKDAGFNAVRTSHNPPSETFLNTCDKLGLLVLDESFDCWKWGKNSNDYSKYFDMWWQRDLEAMVKRDLNHPSIIIWSIGNEIVERGEPQAVKTAAMLAKALKKIDNTRPVTSAVCVLNDKPWTIFDSLFAVHDVAGYNYKMDSAPDDHKRVPSRIILQTESFPKDAFDNWKMVQNNNYVIGDFVWTAMDYLGESGIGGWYYNVETPEMYPWHGAYCGDIDEMGRRKSISHYRSLLYNNTEKLYMAVREPEKPSSEIKVNWWTVWPTWESWTWPGFEGKNVQVEVYSKYPKVRLYLNDKLIEEKATAEGQQFKAIFSVPYSPGILKAVGVENGKEIESKVLQTSGDVAKIKLTVDRKVVLANGQDLSYVTIELTDKNGIIQPNAANPLQFKIKGPGVIAGVDNADMQDFDQYVGNSRKAWKGRALAVIRTTHNVGDIKLTVSSPSLPEAVLNIKTVKP
jgi:beta-galactosidase